MTELISLQKDPSSPDRHVYRVSELNQDVRMLLETGFPQLWIEGEISNFACPTSGHWYFSLKDSKAQVRCAMFKNKNRSVGFTPKQGDQVLVKAKISLYEARGEFQLIIEGMEEAGFGALQRAFDALKNKLNKEGLFDRSVKQTLPDLPKQIGVITSPTGAAIRDILSVLKRRFPGVPVLVYPVAVQGDLAADQIVHAIEIANCAKHCDVLILARGGGSLEDLWCFNEEKVARAIFHADIPIVTGIGHEVDFTIADFVADVRAATPSAAAEQVVPDREEFYSRLQLLKQQLVKAVTTILATKQDELRWANSRIRHPSQQLREISQRLDELELRLVQATKHSLNYKQLAFNQLLKHLKQFNPTLNIKKYRQALKFLNYQLRNSVSSVITAKSNQLTVSARTLHAVSPLATLDRGYAIVSHRNNNCIVRNAHDVKPNEEIKVKLSHGELSCVVKKIRES